MHDKNDAKRQYKAKHIFMTEIHQHPTGHLSTGQQDKTKNAPASTFDIA